MHNSPSFTLSHLAEHCEAELKGDAEYTVSGLADLKSAVASDISFLASSKYIAQLSVSRAGAIVLKPEDQASYSGNKLLVPDPYLAYAKLSALFETRASGSVGVHPTAVVADSASIADGVSIGPHCVIGERVIIGSRSEICAGVIVGDGARIGEHSIVHANTVIYHDVEIGKRVIIHANTSIGCDGFGFAPAGGCWQKIHQIGSVIIGDDVEIGANTAVDRGALENTVISNNVIIDNQVHIAHNCHIGEGTALAGCVGIAGSTRVGKNCLVGGAVAIGGHIEIADGTVFNGGTIAPKGTKEAGVYASAAPMQDVGSWRKNSARYRQLDTMFRRLGKLEKRVDDAHPEP